MRQSRSPWRRRGLLSAAGLALISARAGAQPASGLSVPWSSGTERPRLVVPPDAVDCHHHIYDSRYPLNAAATLQRMQSYIDASARMRDIAQQCEVDVFISNHSGFDEAIAKLAASQSSGQNAFVTGVDATTRALTVMNQCAQATLAAWSA